MKWIALLCVLVAIAGCGDKITNQYTTINEAYTEVVHAKVFGWRCAVGDIVNNSGGPGKFDSTESRRAKVTFEYINGNSHSEYTDDSSEVAVELPHGPYRIIVETEYTRPDTFFNYVIPRDTVVELNVTYDQLFIDSIHIGFMYDPAGESLGYSREFHLLQQLGDHSGQVFVAHPNLLRRTEQTLELFGTVMTFNDYYIPIRRESRLSTCEAIDVVRSALYAGRVAGTFPASMNLNSVGYICLD